MISRNFRYQYLYIFFATTIGFVVACTSIDNPKQWDNPLDPYGINYHPPKVYAGNDTTVAVNQEIKIRPLGSNENVSVFCWKKGDNEWDTLPVTEPYTLKWTKPADTGDHKIYIKAVNSSDQVSLPDSLTVTVVLYKPLIEKIADTSVNSSAEVFINFTAEDPDCEIVNYLINIGDSGWDTITTASYTFSNINNGPLEVIWAAVNTYDILTADTFEISFNRVPASAALINPEPDEPAKFKSFNFPDLLGDIAFEFQATDPDSNSDTLTFYFYLGKYDSVQNLVYSGKESSCIVKNIMPGTKYSWCLCVKDLFEDSIAICGDFTTESTPDCPQRMKLIKSKDESFSMGQKGFLQHESFVHTVSLDYNFWIDSTEITNEFFESITGIKKAQDGEGNFSVSDISWFDAVLFCNSRSRQENLDTVYKYTMIIGTPGKKCSLEGLVIDDVAVGYRLPTEAEWEFACRAGTKSLFYWGNERIKTENHAWVSLTSGNEVHKVGKKAANQYGLYDMSGNLWEWCNDWYDAQYYSVSPQDNPAGPQIGIERVIRGGSWKHSDYYAQSGSRSKLNPKTGNETVGFRTVLIIK